MSNCPHCNKKLRIIDWRPNCPHCGVNLMFYGFEERFYEDAKRSELSMAGMRVGSKRMKAGLAGSLWAKVRLCICLLPLLSLLLPWGSLNAKLPFAAQEWQAGALGLANLFMGNKDIVPYFQDMWGGPWSAVFQQGILLLGAAALAAVLGLVVALLSLLSFLKLKRMSTAVVAMSVLGMLVSAGGFVIGELLQKASDALANPVFTGALGWGALLSFAAFACTGFASLMLRKKGVHVEFAEGDEERAELYKKVKAGEIKLEDLPYPVVETEATRELEATIEKEIGGETA
ncbi:MAG: FYVE zinc finger domain-containing protein [Oscillospiraceae bacterium]|nr:FYVE zinc finger domain-containing protein [Oscillospiraceae bacterium]